MLRPLLAALVLPLAASATLPLPTHGQKGLPPQVFHAVHAHLKALHQFDLGKLGIPVEKSLRLAGSVAGPHGPQALIAVSPEPVAHLVAWYRRHLKHWKVTDHVRGKAATLVPTARSGVFGPGHGRPSITVNRCLRGHYEVFACASVVRFYRR